MSVPCGCGGWLNGDRSKFGGELRLELSVPSLENERGGKGD
jgi:hypothetical protein